MNRFFSCLIVILFFSACNSSNPYDAEGNFESDEVTISAQTTGNIVSLNIKEGGTLLEGEIVGAIDSMQLYYQKMQLLSSGTSIENSRPDIKKQVSALQEQIKKQKREKLRFENLLHDGAATQKQVDDIVSTIAVLEGQLQAQESSLESSVATLDAKKSGIDMQVGQIDDMLKKSVIKSPINGVVLVKYAQKGEFAGVGKPLFKVADLNNVYLRCYLTSGQLSEVKIGQKVEVVADFGGKSVKSYEGVVEWISSKTEFTPKNIQTKNERENLVYAVKIGVKNDGFIKLGMYGGVIL
jgi:HlyD family secretion protein